MGSVPVEIIVAVITASGLGIATVIPLLFQARRQHRKVSERIGEPNGHGSLVVMMTELLSHVRGNTTRIGRLETGLVETRHMIGRLGDDHAEIRTMLEDHLGEER